MCRVCGTAVSARACPRADFMGGTLAGTAALVIGYPFDTVKVRFQSGLSQYTSTLHALQTILRTEGPRSLFRGILPPMVSCAPLNGLVFVSYRGLMRLQLPHKDATPTLSNIFWAGAGTGIVGSTLVTPIELLKIRQQVAAAEGQPILTTYETARQVFRESGVRGLYRGITATALRDVGYGVYFLTYEASTRLAAHIVSPGDARSEQAKQTPAPWPILLLSGGLAGAAGWLFTFPFDVLKTRIQAGDAPANSFAALRVVYKEGGWGVFWRGLAPTLIRAVPVNMVNFGVFEGVLYMVSH